MVVAGLNPRPAAIEARRLSDSVFPVMNDIPDLMGNTRMELEILVARALATCLHPYATWRARSSKRRALVIFAYVVGSYVVALGLLFAQ